jgi:hypothetical protein
MKNESIWGCGELVFSAPKVLAASFASTGDDSAAVFSDWQLELQGDAAPLYLTQVASIRVPISVAEKQVLVGYVQTVNIGIERTPGVRGVIVADFMGSLHSLEFGFETPHGAPPGGSSAEKFWRTFSHQGLELTTGTGLPGSVPDYQASIMVTLQRRSLSDHGIITIGGLDVKPAVFPPMV